MNLSTIGGASAFGEKEGNNAEIMRDFFPAKFENNGDITVSLFYAKFPITIPSPQP